MFKLFLIFNFLIGVFCNIENKIYLKSIKEDDNLFKFYNPNIDHFQSIINQILLNSNKSIINSECENSLIQINNGINSREEWALKYFESNGKIRDGFLSGYNLDLGNYDLCLSLNERSFNGQYCLVSIQSTFLDTIKKENFYKTTMNNVYPHTKKMIDFHYGSVIGLCIPSNCHINDLIKSYNNEFSKFNLTITPQNKCSTIANNNHSNFNIKLLISFLIIIIPFSISIFSLFIDYEHKYLKPFSLKDNFNYIYRDHKIDDDSFMHGLKFFYVIISVPYHLVGLFYSSGYASFLQASVKISNFYFLKPLIERSLLGIDIMIAFSAFRLYQSIYDSLKKKKPISKILLQWPINYWPGYVAYICLLIILPSISNGPYRDIYDHFLTNCKFNWYKLFTFTSNYDYLPDLCINVSWFNSANFQLSLIHYILVFVFIFNQKLGLIFTLIQLALSIVIEYYRMITLNIDPYMTSISDEIVGFEIFKKDYTSLFSHLAPFTIGFLTGYFYKHNKTSYLNNSLVYYGGWIFSITSLLFSFLFPELFEMNFISKNNTILIGFYFCMKRIFFTIPFIFIICSFKAGLLKPFKRIASFEFYQPISKLSSSIITCQFLYFFYFLSTRRSAIAITIENLIREFILTLIFVFIISNLFYFFFDAPITKLLRKLILEDKKTLKENKTLESNEKKND